MAKQSPKSADDKPGWQKALWFVGLWLAGVLTISVIGLIVKSVLG